VCRGRAGGGILPKLGRQLSVAGAEEAYERTLGERRTDGLDLRESSAASKHIQKLCRLAAGPTEEPPFEQKDAPRKNGQEDEAEKYTL